MSLPRPPSRFSIFRRQPIPYHDRFTQLLETGAEQPLVKPIPRYDIIPLGLNRTVYEETCVSGTRNTLALVQRKHFEIYKITFVASKWRFTPICTDIEFGTDSRHPSSCWRVLAAMSDVAIFLAPPGKVVEVYNVEGKLVRNIKLDDQCRSIVVSRCGRFVAVSTTLGVCLYDAGTTGLFGDTDIVSSKIKEMDGAFDDRGAANCMAFSQDSLLFSVCNSENMVYTYSVGDGTSRPKLLYEFDRKFGSANVRQPYYGISGLALYSSVRL